MGDRKSKVCRMFVLPHIRQAARLLPLNSYLENIFYITLNLYYIEPFQRLIQNPVKDLRWI